MAQNPGEPESEDLVEWLKDAARRDKRPPMALNPLAEPPPPKPRSRGRAVLLSAFAALSYLPYFYAEVYLEIARLPTLIVFVPVHLT